LIMIPTLQLYSSPPHLILQHFHHSVNFLIATASIGTTRLSFFIGMY
jgi:hypothetical protein